MNIINKYKAYKEIDKVSSKLYSDNLYYIFFSLYSYVPDYYNTKIIHLKISCLSFQEEDLLMPRLWRWVSCPILVHPSSCNY